MSGHDNTLQIKNVAYNDSGSYVCVATSILGKAQKTVKLTVEGDAKEAVIYSVGDNRFPFLFP